MKANRSFQAEAEAVSPVIGVILMVAITVVLGAVVFVMVSDLGGDSEAALAVAWSKEEAMDKVEVTSAASGSDWSRLAVKMTGCSQANDGAVIRVGSTSGIVNVVAGPGGAALNTPAAGANCGAATAPVAVMATVQPLIAGDFLSFCSAVAGTDPSNVVIQLIDVTANAKVWEGSFSNLRSCGSVVLAFSASGGTITATPNGPGFDWQTINIEMTACTQPAWGAIVRLGSTDDAVHVNEAIGLSGKPVNSQGATCLSGVGAFAAAASTQSVVTGDTLRFCYDPMGPTPTGVSIKLVDTTGPTDLQTLALPALPACGVPDLFFQEVGPGVIEVVSNNNGKTWAGVEVSASCYTTAGALIHLGNGGSTNHVNQAGPTTTGPPLSTAADPCGSASPKGLGSTAAMVVGDRFYLCSTVAGVSDVRVDLRDTSPGILSIQSVYLEQVIPTC